MHLLIAERRTDFITTEAQRRAIQNYKKKLNRITIDFSPAEADLWEHIQNQEKKQTYIKQLIREDIKRGRE